MSTKNTSNLLSDYLNKQKTNSATVKSETTTKKKKAGLFSDYLTKRDSGSLLSPEQVSNTREVIRLNGGNDLSTRIANPSVNNIGFYQSEKREADRRAVKQAQRDKAIKVVEKDEAASESEKEKKSSSGAIDTLKYLGARGLLSAKTWVDNARTFAEGEAESWKDSLKQSSNAIKQLVTNPSDLVSDAYEKMQSGEAKKEKDKSRYTAYEKATARNISGKGMAEIEKKYPEQNSNPAVKAIGDLTASVVNMVPSIAVGFVPTVGPLAGAGLMAATSAPDAYSQARIDGATHEQAINYSNLEAINQGLGDILIGGIAGFGKGVISSAADTVTGGASTRLAKRALGKLATSPAGKTTVKYFGNILGEGSEEMLQSLVSTMNARMAFDPDAKVEWDEVAYEGLLGGMMGGFFGAAQIPSNYKAYKSDADLVKTFARSAEKIESVNDATTLQEVGNFVIAQMDETIESAADDDIKERAEFIKAEISSVIDNVDEYGAQIIETNNDISDAIDAIGNSSPDDIIQNTARLVDIVADYCEPDVDPIKVAIDALRSRIQDQQETIKEVTTPEELRESRINEAVLKEIDSTLRSHKEEVASARAELPENNLTVPAESDTVKVGNSSAVASREVAEQPIQNTEANAQGNKKQAMALEYSTQKHTKTGEQLHVVKIPNHVSSEEYSQIKNQIKKFGGYYSKFAKGFIIPNNSISKVSETLGEIGVGLNGYTNATAESDTSASGNNSNNPVSNISETSEIDNSTTVSSQASLVFPDGLKTADKTKFKRLFKKWAENEHVNISDMNSEKARLFASYASKLYNAGFNGAKPILNYANLTKEEMTSFPSFLENTFYNLGKEAAEKSGKAAQASESATSKASDMKTAEKIMDDLGLGGGTIVDVNDNGEIVGEDYTPIGDNTGILSDSQAGNLEHPDNATVQSVEVTENQIPEVSIADYVAEQLKNGKKISNTDLQSVANVAFGGTQAEGAYDVKSMTDAAELGVNKHLISLISENPNDFNSANANDAVNSIREISDDILAKIPTQTKRSDEQISLQQFSTPPNIAYTAAWLANIDSNDTVLEPSAGIGGLASFAKAFGAETIVNELSERRLAVLKNLPFDEFYNENAEQIDNILPDSVKPTVVIMNPPFSSNGGRTKNSTKNAIPHIEQALLRLEDGGRLVAILGRGMADDTPTFKGWWNDLRKDYNIRANIGINGENYRKYGTTFDVQLVVIDKTGAQTGETITGYYDNLEDIPALLEGVRNDRTRTNEANRAAQQNAAVESVEEASEEIVSGRTRTDSDSSTRGISGRGDTAATRGILEDATSDRTGGAGEPSVVAESEAVQSEGDIRVSDDGGERGRLDGGITSGTGSEQGQGGVDSRNSGAGTEGQSVSVVQSEPVTETPKKRTVKKAVENDDGVYAEYKTVPLTIKGAKKHPAKLVESSAMSAVSSPVLTYTPNLDKSLISSGALSDAQLENISYAGQAHSQTLPNGERKGYFIGDGTGVGKGRQLAGIIMDNWNQGRRKAIWISENKNLSEDARRDWKDLGGDPAQIIDWEKAQKKGLTANEGILFIPYSSLIGGKTKKRETTTLETIENWFGKDFDGVIVFDEAHNMGNLIPMKGARGSKKPSQKAIAGNKLQTELPNARVTYASATGATNIENLSYAARLGLWGENTSFRDAQDFISKIGRAGIAAMELVARDMKSMGVYLARSISYDGVVYDNIQHKLTSVQRKMYDGMSEGWQVVLQNFDKAMQATNSQNAKDVKQKRGRVYGNMQQFYNQVLTSMAMPTVIKDIEKQLAAGKSCVIQLVNTNEAAQDKAVSDANSEGKTDLDDLDITPRQLLVGYVENAFPVHQYEEYMDENGNLVSRMVTDSSGKPVFNKQAVRMKENLIAQLNEISIPEGPLDMLLNHFGADQVAEVTGRSGRVLTVKDENGNEHKQYVSRNSGKSNIAETKDFQDGKKRILVFSAAGSTGRSFHADKRAANQQQRIHYVLQPGWKAETAVQGFGRTHRSNQVNTPVFRLVSTDVMGHKRFVTSIARRLDQLGALTKGQRQTGSGVFGEKDNLESPLSSQALREFYRRLGNGRIEGLDAKDVLGKMGLDKAFYDEYDRFTLNESIVSDIPKFLNRILALPVEKQNKVFTAFENIRDSFYQQALESGKLDLGLENIKADKIEIAQDDVVYTDPVTGAETRYVKAKLYNKPSVIKTVEDAEGYRDNFKGIYRMQDGSVRAVYRLADKTNEWGLVQKNFVLISPNTGIQSRYIESTLKAKTEEIPKSEWESAWAEELKNVPEFNESERHMITGALLPIWNRLPESENVKAQRIVASDGTQYLGRIIQKDSVDSTLRQLDVKTGKTEYTGASIYDSIMKKGNSVTMRGVYGGTLTLTRRRVSNENRIEVSGAGTAYLSDKYTGIYGETIQFVKRYFIPVGEKGVAILDQMVKDLGVRSVDSEDSGAYYSLGSSRGKWGKGDSKAQVMSINELTRQASRIFGVEINTGKIGKKGAAGVFKTHAGTIRTRQYGDLPTIAHELGHWFDKKYNFTASPHISELVDEFGIALKADGYTDAQIPYEVVAEYFAAYMNNKTATERKSRKFTSWMYDTLSTTDQKRLFEYAGMTNAYYAADLERRADAQIHTRVQDSRPLVQAQLQLDTLLRNPSAYLGALSRKATRLFIDDLIDLRSFGGTYDLAMFEKTADSVTAGRLTSAMTDRYGNAIGRSFRDILSDGNINDMNRLDFDKYLVACVALDRIEAAEKAAPNQRVGSLVYGDERLQDKDSILDRIAQYERDNPTFHDTAEQVYVYQCNLMQLAVDSGLMSQELVDKLNEAYPHYVPLYRVMDSVSGKDGKGRKGYANQSSPLARFKGSGRDIYSPIENIMLNTEKFTKACMRNDVMQEFTAYVDTHEDLGWAAEKVPETNVFDVISTDSIAKRLSAFQSERLNSMSSGEIEELMGEVVEFIGDYAGMWKPAAKQGRNVVSVMRGGKREYYEIHDSDLMKCLTNMDARQNGHLMQFMEAVTSKFKVLTTGSNPIFGVTNVSRDLASGFVSSTTTNNPIKYTGDFIKAWWAAVSESDDYKAYMRNGGGYSGALTQDYKHLKHAEGEVVKTTNALKRIVTIVADAIPRLVDAGESASRYAEYKRARELGIDALEAIRKSQEVTVNFARGGTVTKEIDKIIPYFRASVNSMYHMVDVLSSGNKKQLASKWAKFVALNSVPAIISFAWRALASELFDEDEDEVAKAYDSLSAYNKNAYWCYYVGNGNFFRYAKPKDMTVFSTVIERLAEYSMLGEQDALHGLSGYVVDSLLPPTARDASIFGTALSLAENKTFTGAPIVSSAYQYLAPELQYKGDTSKFAVALGSALNVSPMQIDFILDDNFGYVGTLITNLTRQDGEINLGFLNKFIVDSTYSTDTANIFYDTKEMYESNAASYKHTGGSDTQYTLADVYGKYKYGKVADSYSALNSYMKAETNADTSREMKKRMNEFLKAVNDTGMTDLDKAVIDIAEITGVEVSDIAPYVVVPDVVTYSSKGFKEKFSLTFDEILEYYAESQLVLTARYEDILNSGYSEEMMAEAMIEVKKEVAKQMRDRWEEKKFKQKYN